jgi:hypothetical protein
MLEVPDSSPGGALQKVRRLAHSYLVQFQIGHYSEMAVKFKSQRDAEIERCRKLEIENR